MMEMRSGLAETERSLNETFLDEGSSTAQVANSVGQAAEAADNTYIGWRWR